MRKALRTTAVLALPAFISAGSVHLSDMTPRASNLPPTCNSIYTAVIPGCTSSDWTSQQCSDACISSLQSMVAPIEKACSGQGVQGQNLIVAFLAGVGPKQLCHNAPDAAAGTTTTAAPTTQETTTEPITSGTTTARRPTGTNSLVTDSSSSSSETSSTKSTQSTQKPRTTQTTIESSSAAPMTTTKTSTRSPTSSPTKTSTAEGSSETSFDDNSGGGSPFDTPGNLMNGAGFSTPALSVMLPAALAAIFAVLR